MQTLEAYSTFYATTYSWLSDTGDTVITIYDGTFESLDDYVFALYAREPEVTTTVTIYGGTFITYDDTVMDNDGTANIYGGEFLAKNEGDYPNYYNVVDNGGQVYLYGGSFEADEGTAALMGETFTIVEGYYADPADWETTGASSVTILKEEITVKFNSEGILVSSYTGAPAELVLPENPISSGGCEFLYWETISNTPILDVSTVKTDLDLYAVFSDRTYAVTFDDQGTLTTVTVTASTPLIEVPGFLRSGGDDLFIGWKMGESTLTADTTEKVYSNLALTAVYQGLVFTYDELIEALANKEPLIYLGADILVEDTIVVDYDCKITSLNKFGLIRPIDFLGVLLSVTGGVTGGENLAAVSSTGPRLTLDNVLIDGRSILASAPAVLVDQATTLALANTTIRNNINNATDRSLRNGGAVFNDGTLIMNAGTLIEGNQAYKGGGVYNSPRSAYPVVFQMNCGSITGNIATDSSYDDNSGGGGVNVDDNAIFYMYGGSITGNQAPNGSAGGVSLGYGDSEDPDYAFNSFYMYGGEITDNYAAEYGGGVYLGGDAMTMEGGLISRNTAGWEGGGISTYPMGDPNLKMSGGTISLNAAGQYGGGIGTYVGGSIFPAGIYDNLASVGADDIVFNRNDFLSLKNNYTARAFYASYASPVELSGTMQTLISIAKPTINVELITNAPEPTGVMVPFYGWYTDGKFKDTSILRYPGLDGNKWSLSSDPINWEKSNDAGASVKSIWYGLLLLYDANHGNGDYQYDTNAYLPGAETTVLSNMFERPGYRFVGWNSQADGQGTSYAAEDKLVMQKSTTIYAQWEKIPTGSLIISKTISGNAVDESWDFSFVVKLSDTSFNGTYGEMVFENGVANFKLRGGESITARDLPAGLGYTVNEMENEEFIVTINGSPSVENSGSVVVDETTTLTFNNHKDMAPLPGGSVEQTATLTPEPTATPTSEPTATATLAPTMAPTNQPTKTTQVQVTIPNTSDSSNIWLYLLLTIVSLVAMAGTAIYARKKK